MEKKLIYCLSDISGKELPLFDHSKVAELNDGNCNESFCRKISTMCEAKVGRNGVKIHDEADKKLKNDMRQRIANKITDSAIEDFMYENVLKLTCVLDYTLTEEEQFTYVAYRNENDYVEMINLYKFIVRGYYKKFKTLNVHRVYAM